MNQTVTAPNAHADANASAPSQSRKNKAIGEKGKIGFAVGPKNGDDWSTVSEAAMIVVQKLNRRTIAELHSYQRPPAFITETIAPIICCLFGVPESWENAKKILAHTSNTNRLLQFNPYSVKKAELQRLQTLCAHFYRDLDTYARKSQAASAFALFAHTLVEFRCAPKVIPPSQQFRHSKSRMTMYGALIPLR